MGTIGHEQPDRHEHDRECGGERPIGVERLLAPESPSAGQLWVRGKPGESGSAGGLRYCSCSSAPTIRRVGADAREGGPCRGVRSRAHDETVAVTHGVEATPMAVVRMDELRVTTGRTVDPG
jgi:hypothetical protein